MLIVGASKRTMVCKAIAPLQTASLVRPPFTHKKQVHNGSPPPPHTQKQRRNTIDISIEMNWLLRLRIHTASMRCEVLAIFSFLFTSPIPSPCAVCVCVRASACLWNIEIFQQSGSSVWETREKKSDGVSTMGERANGCFRRWSLLKRTMEKYTKNKFIDFCWSNEVDAPLARDRTK